MYPWTFVVTDLKGNPLGEVINPDNRKVSSAISRASTAGFQLRSDNPLNGRIRAQTYDVLGKAYYGATLRFHGTLTGYQRVGQSGANSIAYTFGDPYSLRFQKRHLNRTSNILLLNGGTATDRGSLVKLEIDTNATEQGEHGVRTGTQAYQGGSVITYNMAPFKPLNEFIAEMQAGAQGFEWRMLPIEYAAGKIVDWYAAPTIGQLKQDVVLEYGIGKHNLTGATEQGDLTTIANDVFHIAQTGPNAPGAPIVEAVDATSVARRGTYSDIAQAQITDQQLRQELVNAHVAVRAGWRRVFTVTPATYDDSAPYRVPQLGRDFDVGDTVRFRANWGDEQPDEVGYDGFVRIWGVDDAPDKTGKITRTLSLVSQ